MYTLSARPLMGPGNRKSNTWTTRGHVAYNDVGLKVEWSAPAAGFEPNKHHN